MKFVIKHMTMDDISPVMLEKVRIILMGSRHQCNDHHLRRRITIRVYLNKSIGRFGNINILLFVPVHMTFFIVNYRIPQTMKRLRVHPYHVNIRKQVCRLSNFLSLSTSTTTTTTNNKKNEARKGKFMVDVYGFTWCQVNQRDRVLPSISSIRGVAADKRKFRMCTRRNMAGTMLLTI